MNNVASTVAEKPTPRNVNAFVKPSKQNDGLLSHEKEKNPFSEDLMQWFEDLTMPSAVAGPVANNQAMGLMSIENDLSSHSTGSDQAELSQNMMRLSEKIEEATSAPSEIDCALLLPNLGEVRLMAKETKNDWHIRLEFIQRQAYDEGRKQKQKLKQRLTEQLSKPVRLSIFLRGESDEC